jgi:hypothetical protein
VDSLYYLDNFQRVLASLDARYAELLSPEERQFIAHFGVLPQAPRALLVRMVMRRGVFFRRSRLHYTEIGETSSAMAPLLDAGWVKVDPALDVKQLERLLTKGELIQHFSLSRQCRKLKKSELVNCLSAQYPDARPFHGWSDAGFRVLCALPRSQTEGDVEKKASTCDADVATAGGPADKSESRL